MQEGYPLSFCAQSRRFVDKGDSGLSAFLESVVEVGNRNTNVMYPRATLRQIFGYRTLGRG